MKKNIWLALVSVAAFIAFGCSKSADNPKPNLKVVVENVKTNAEGFTVEQENIRNRLRADNTPGAVKHLYVISAYSGQVILYSTVKGKVTSSGKRLTPTTAWAGSLDDYWDKACKAPLKYAGIDTTEVQQDDGTFGYSIDYVYWWDSKGVYHQHYVSGGQILHVSDQPLAVKSIIINIEEAK